MPTLVIPGDSDAIVPFEVTGKRSHELIPDSELVLIEGGPHGVKPRTPSSSTRRRSTSGVVDDGDHGRPAAHLCATGPPPCVAHPPVVSDVWLGRMPT